jgi:hypothetical protein
VNSLESVPNETPQKDAPWQMSVESNTILNTPLTMEVVESSAALSVTNIHGVLFCDDVCDVISSSALLEKMGDIMRSADDWENHVESDYPMKQGRENYSQSENLSFEQISMDLTIEMITICFAV